MNLFAKNIAYLREKNNLSQAAMLSQLGIPRTTWISYEIGKAEPDIDRILHIADYFETDLTTLLTVDLSKGNLNELRKVAQNLKKGKGNSKGIGKLNDPKASFQHLVNEPQTAYKTPQIPVLVTVDQHGNDNIVFVPVKAQAGYLLGYGDPEYIETLPAFQMPGLRTGTFRMFEVQGVSMAPVLSNTDRVICEYVNSMDEIRENRIHVVVHAGGIAVKRLINRIKEDGCIYMKSDTLHHRADYPITPIDPADIKEIWYVRMRITSDLREPSEVYTRITELELKMQAVALKLGLK